jgi:hypothetical protein
MNGSHFDSSSEVSYYLRQYLRKEQSAAIHRHPPDKVAFDCREGETISINTHTYGQLISPMPVMHMSKNAFRLFNNEQVIGMQLMLNYVFGHEKSSLALLPYSPFVNFVNNHVDYAQVLRQVLGRQVCGVHPWPRSCWADARFGGDEIYIDYGAKWDEAWADHVENWKAPPRSHEFVPVEVLNDEEEIKTEIERVEEPLGYNVVTLCWLDTRSISA